MKWAAPGPANVGVGTGTSVAAEDSWDYCVGLVTPQGPNAAAAAAAGAVFGEWPAAAVPGKMEALGHSEWVEGPEVVAEDLLQPPHLYHPLASQTWHYVAASEGGAGASAEVQLWPAAGALSPCNLAPAALADHLAAEGQGVALLKGPGPLEAVASLVVPGNSGPVVAVVAGTEHDLPSDAAAVVGDAVASESL